MRKLGQRLNSKLSWRRLNVLFMTVLFGTSMMLAPVTARADQYDNQINALQAQNASTESELDGLVGNAQNYQEAINNLQTQISEMQTNINANLAEQASIELQITQAQQKLTYEKGVLAQDLQQMYVDGTPTTIEMLATSKSLSDFVDKQEYRTEVQEELVTTTQQITTLQLQLSSQESTEQSLLKGLQSQQSQLSYAQTQQEDLLAYNQQQQASYNAELTANNSKINQLKAEQFAAELASINSGKVQILSSANCGGTYPADASGSNGNWGCDFGLDDAIDNWGMLNRECVSYTAWRVYETYGYMPYWGGSGNAAEWPGDAAADGIPMGSAPEIGSVAIATPRTDPYVSSLGHAMWVEGISGSEITVSQFNYQPGVYSVMTIPISYISTFIYFSHQLPS
jgi:peptidoglycan hydrolase CwlO-like protein